MQPYGKNTIYRMSNRESENERGMSGCGLRHHPSFFLKRRGLSWRSRALSIPSLCPNLGNSEDRMTPGAAESDLAA